MVRIGSTSGTTDSAGSSAPIGHAVSSAPSDSFKLFGDGVVNTRPLLAAPTERLWPVPMTPTQSAPSPPSGRPPSPPFPPPQLATRRAPVAMKVLRRIRCAAVYCARPRRKMTIVERALRAMTTSLVPPPARCQARYHGSLFNAGVESTISGTYRLTSR